MKIEKLNDHQIRCTLTKAELSERHIKLSELAYGSEKTRALFQDMMDQALADFGFEVENIPIMIEAMPVSADKIVLVITKADLPEDISNHLPPFLQDWEDDSCPEKRTPSRSRCCLFVFCDINDCIDAARLVAPFFHGKSALYKDPVSNEYRLFVHQQSISDAEFNRVLFTLNAYMENLPCPIGCEAHLREHGKTILRRNALQQLACL